MIWIWVLTIVYLCIGSFITGVYVAEEDDNSITKNLIMGTLIIFFWIFGLGLHILFCLTDLDTKFELFLDKNEKRIRNWMEYWSTRKQRKEEDEELEESEEDWRLQRMGVNSRTDVWDSYSD